MGQIGGVGEKTVQLWTRTKCDVELIVTEPPRRGLRSQIYSKETKCGGFLERRKDVM